MVVSIAQARCGLLPPHSFYPLFVLFLKFQSLKRDVAFFHLALFTPTNYTFEVSIAQARCGLLPLTGGHLLAQVSWLFQSLKRDVAFFHAQEQPCCRETHAGFNRSSAMWPSSTLLPLPKCAA